MVGSNALFKKFCIPCGTFQGVVGSHFPIFPMQLMKFPSLAELNLNILTSRHFSGIGAGLFWLFSQRLTVDISEIGSPSTNITIDLVNTNNPTLSQSLRNTNTAINTNNDADTITQTVINTNENNGR